MQLLLEAYALELQMRWQCVEPYALESPSVGLPPHNSSKLMLWNRLGGSKQTIDFNSNTMRWNAPKRKTQKSLCFGVRGMCGNLSKISHVPCLEFQRD